MHFFKAAMDLATLRIIILWVNEEVSVAAVDGRFLSLIDRDPLDDDIHKKLRRRKQNEALEINSFTGCSDADWNCVGRTLHKLSTQRIGHLWKLPDRC